MRLFLHFSDMQFARDAVPDATVTAAARWLSQGIAQERWLLLDPALVDARRLRRIVPAGASSSALLGSALETFAEAAPQMISVGAEVDLTSLVERIVDLDRTSPAMTLFKSIAPPSRIREVFAELALVRVDHDLRLHCRFADARVLPSLLDVITPAQRGRIRGCIRAWGWIGASGVFVSRDFEAAEGQIEASTRSGSFCGLELSAQQFARMLDDSEPDTVFASLLDTVPELVPGDGRGGFRGRLVDHLRSADALGVHQPTDRLQFVVLSLTCGSDFHRAAILGDTWKMMREAGASLKSLMSTWSDATWEEIERAARGSAVLSSRS